ncbi:MULTISPECIES: glycoside hydrolase family 10 protein [unclassified Coleofasciculus]|uniref:glycoside hydrolase family 10 protein n=1 Tax=unclassified Coleofasciculus TaxID=2692782 RepID=UPI0018809107|nr:MULTISPECIES: glycoside hydrolase family 10 protein [unclassified Coleofasciculus]MBE9126250.1 glycoside hydrolase family 10 protein [Coleofasciculus sp. LEGE 07081]MBE9148139.1 glycoside hydrolase family 10 protein [Coleofasciculus sp. LEGE 07092]
MKKYQAWLNYVLCLGLALGLAILSHPAIFPIKSLGSPQTLPALTEIRGVWLTNVASGVLFSPWGINRALYQLSQLNFNTVYPVVWNRGHTFYPSAVAESVTTRKQDALLDMMRLGGDVLAEIVEQGHRQGLRVIPWFEYGFMAPPNSELVQRHPNWIGETPKLGKPAIASADILNERVQVWLNPLHPEVQQLIFDLIVEVVTQYDVDGIQLDDHFGMPVELGYDPFTVELYQQEHGGKSPPSYPLDSEWMRWRANKISAFMQRIFEAVKSIKPNCLVSLSPNPESFAYKYYLQDWSTWVKRGWIDELVLQVYRNDLKSFQSELVQPGVQLARRQIPVSIGITTGTRLRPVAMKQIQEQVQAVRDRGFDGVSFFYWETLWSYITPESPQQRRKGFRELFPYE